MGSGAEGVQRSSLSVVLLSIVSVSYSLEADDTLQKYGQVTSSLMLHHNAYDIHLTSSHHKSILSSHIITGIEYNILTEATFTYPYLQYNVIIVVFFISHYC